MALFSRNLPIIKYQKYIFEHLQSYSIAIINVDCTMSKERGGLTKKCFVLFTDRGTTGYNVFFYLWVLSAFVTTCYTFIWDVKMDWGLFDKNAADNRFLREELVYAHKVTHLIIISVVSRY